MEPDYQRALFALDENGKRYLNYAQFSSLLLNVEAACPEHINFNTMVNGMTLALSNPIWKEEFAELFERSNIHASQRNICLADIESAASRIERTRINRLFDLWDAKDLEV